MERFYTGVRVSELGFEEYIGVHHMHKVRDVHTRQREWPRKGREILMIGE